MHDGDVRPEPGRPESSRGESGGTEWVRAHVLVRGKVQGVFYRATAQDRGCSLGITGWIRNLPNGQVEALFEGPRERVEDMIAWCRRGPPLARVEALDLDWLPATREFTTLRVTF